MAVDREARVRPWEIGGESVPVGDKNVLKFKSHWNRDECVVMVFAGDEGGPPVEMTFSVKDLLAAIKSCSRGY